MKRLRGFRLAAPKTLGATTLADLAVLTQLIEPEATALGFDLVRVRMIGGASDPTLQVMAERPDTRQLTIDDRKLARMNVRFDQVADAKLLITDRLIAATAPLSSDGAEEIEEVPEGAEMEGQD